MTPECWGQYALENKDCISSVGADRLYTVSQVYRPPARTVRSRSDGIPQSGAYGSLHKVGIPSSGVQRVKDNELTAVDMLEMLHNVDLVPVSPPCWEQTGWRKCIRTRLHFG